METNMPTTTRCFRGLLILLSVLLVIWLGVTWGLSMAPREAYRFSRYYLPSGYVPPHEPGFRVLEELGPCSDKPIVSMSLYGTNPKYVQGTIQLLQDLKEQLPEWQPRVYAHDQLSSELVNRLLDQGAEVYRVHDKLVAPGNSAGMFWRFLPAADNVTFICLDVDEPLAPGLVDAVHAWYPVRHDWPYFRYNYGQDGWPSNIIWPQHCFVGGKWGMAETVNIARDMIEEPGHRTSFGSDEVWLAYYVAPEALKHGLWSGYYKLWHQYASYIQLWPYIGPPLPLPIEQREQEHVISPTL